MFSKLKLFLFHSLFCHKKRKKNEKKTIENVLIVAWLKSTRKKHTQIKIVIAIIPANAHATHLL